jgi:competence protein ComEA
MVLFSILAAVLVARWEARTHPPQARAIASAPAPPAHEARALVEGRRLDPNRATAEELELLPSVGPSLARRIIAEREQHGPFRQMDELLRVKGIGQKTLEKLRPWVKIGSEQVEHATQSQAHVGGRSAP